MSWQETPSQDRTWYARPGRPVFVRDVSPAQEYGRRSDIFLPLRRAVEFQDEPVPMYTDDSRAETSAARAWMLEDDMETEDSADWSGFIRRGVEQRATLTEASDDDVGGDSMDMSVGYADSTAEVSPLPLSDDDDRFQVEPGDNTDDLAMQLGLDPMLDIPVMTPPAAALPYEDIDAPVAMHSQIASTTQTLSTPDFAAMVGLSPMTNLSTLVTPNQPTRLRLNQSQTTPPSSTRRYTLGTPDFAMDNIRRSLARPTATSAEPRDVVLDGGEETPLPYEPNSWYISRRMVDDATRLRPSNPADTRDEFFPRTIQRLHNVNPQIDPLVQFVISGPRTPPRIPAYGQPEIMQERERLFRLRSERITNFDPSSDRREPLVFREQDIRALIREWLKGKLERNLLVVQKSALYEALANTVLDSSTYASAGVHYADMNRSMSRCGRRLVNQWTIAHAFSDVFFAGTQETNRFLWNWCMDAESCAKNTLPDVPVMSRDENVQERAYEDFIDGVMLDWFMVMTGNRNNMPNLGASSSVDTRSNFTKQVIEATGYTSEEFAKEEEMRFVPVRQRGAVGGGVYNHKETAKYDIRMRSVLHTFVMENRMQWYMVARFLRYRYRASPSEAWQRLKELATNETKSAPELTAKTITKAIKELVFPMEYYRAVGMPRIRGANGEFPDLCEANFRILLDQQFITERQALYFEAYVNKRRNPLFREQSTKLGETLVHASQHMFGTTVTLPRDGDKVLLRPRDTSQQWFRYNWALESESIGEPPLCKAWIVNTLFEMKARQLISNLHLQALVRYQCFASQAALIYMSGEVSFLRIARNAT